MLENKSARSRCRRCGQEIAWVRSLKNTNLPVDTEYIKYQDAWIGSCIVTDDGNTFAVKPDGDMLLLPGRMLHFHSCPKAEWRLKKHAKKNNTNNNRSDTNKPLGESGDTLETRSGTRR